MHCGAQMPFFDNFPWRKYQSDVLPVTLRSSICVVLCRPTHSCVLKLTNGTAWWTQEAQWWLKWRSAGSGGEGLDWDPHLCWDGLWSLGWVWIVAPIGRVLLSQGSLYKKGNKDGQMGWCSIRGFAWNLHGEELWTFVMTAMCWQHEGNLEDSGRKVKVWISWNEPDVSSENVKPIIFFCVLYS